MTAVLAILLYVLLGLLALVLLVVALPFQARARGEARQGEVSGLVRLAWAFGLVALELAPGGAAVRVAGLTAFRPRRRGRSAPDGAGVAEGDQDDGDEAEGERRSGMARVRALVRNRRPLVRMAARLAGTLHPRLRLAGRFGLGDPADTAALSVLFQAMGALPGVELRVELDWLDEALTGTAEGSARLWLPEAVAVAGLLLLRREHRAALRAAMG